MGPIHTTYSMQDGFQRRRLVHFALIKIYHWFFNLIGIY